MGYITIVMIISQTLLNADFLMKMLNIFDLREDIDLMNLYFFKSMHRQKIQLHTTN